MALGKFIFVPVSPYKMGKELVAPPPDCVAE